MRISFSIKTSLSRSLLDLLKEVFFYHILFAVIGSMCRTFLGLLIDILYFIKFINCINNCSRGKGFFYRTRVPEEGKGICDSDFLAVLI